MPDYSKTTYAEPFECGSQWAFRVYHYDVTGNREVVIHSEGGFRDKTDAENAAADWCDMKGIEYVLELWA